MTTRLPTVSELIESVRALAGKYPKAVYTPGAKGAQCSYTYGAVTNGPEIRGGCIVGQALPRDIWDAIDANESVRSSGVDFLISEGGYIDSSGSSAVSEQWLADVQGSQDSGKNWKVAVEFADKSERLGHPADDDA